MGFQDILAFNVVMLTKQAWRLIHNEQSLFYRVYKARYFPNSSFLMAELGSNPSVVWRSLLDAIEVLRKGSTWQIGDGNSVGVTTHKWLPFAPEFLHEPNAVKKVCELIDQSSRQWDWGKLAATFTARTCKQILSLPLNRLDSHDTLVWTENKAKTFTVKTAYKVALRLKSGALAEHSSAREHGITWRKIWKLNVPPKVRTFLWRACSNYLPTRDNLSRRKIQVEATCEFCRQEPEIVAHILWKCLFVRNVWALGSGNVQKCSNEVVDFFLRFKHMQETLEPPELDRWAITAWSIWNDEIAIISSMFSDRQRWIMESAVGLLNEYQNLVAAQQA